MKLSLTSLFYFFSLFKVVVFDLFTLLSTTLLLIMSSTESSAQSLYNFFNWWAKICDSTYTHIALQAFVYALGAVLPSIWLFIDPRSKPFISLTVVSICLSIINPVVLCHFLKDNTFILFEFIILCVSTATLLWTQSKFIKVVTSSSH